MAIIHENVLGGDDSSASSEEDGGTAGREQAEEFEAEAEGESIGVGDDGNDGDSSNISFNDDSDDGYSGDYASRSGDSIDDNIRSMEDSRDGSEGASSEVSPKGEEVSEVSAQVFEVTAYTAGAESTGKRPGDAGYGVTASGKTVQEGVTVACPPSLAFGTRLKIEGVGERVCSDRGGDIVEGRLDVYITDLQQAIEFGRQMLEVEIIR